MIPNNYAQQPQQRSYSQPPTPDLANLLRQLEQLHLSQVKLDETASFKSCQNGALASGLSGDQSTNPSSSADSRSINNANNLVCSTTTANLLINMMQVDIDDIDETNGPATHAHHSNNHESGMDEEMSDDYNQHQSMSELERMQ